MAPPLFSSMIHALLPRRRLFHSFPSCKRAAGGRLMVDFLREEIQGVESLKRVATAPSGRTGNPEDKEEQTSLVEVSHPWPEWVELMDHLLKGGYLDRGTFQSSSSSRGFSKDSNHIRTACLNFARERPKLIRHLSRKDIRMIVGYGCPSLDRKVVNSGKRLRAYVGTNEGEVCSSCKLRGNCGRAFATPIEDESGRTLDVIRILLTYGFVAMTESVDQVSNFNQAVKESVRKLLNDIVDLITKGYGPIQEDFRVMPKPQLKVPMKQGDWICPKCNFMNFAKNIKCLRCAGLFEERLRKLREDREHLPLKKGDWICEKCNFFNFAKNIKCVQCDDKPTNRILNPGEWECASCNYINFRKNIYCLKCGWKRPKTACIDHDSAKSHRSSSNPLNSSSDSTFLHFLQKKSSDLPSSPKYSFCKDTDIDGGDRDTFKISAELHDFSINSWW